MIVELYIFLQIVMIGLFVTSYLTRNELLWALTFILSIVLMYGSLDIQQTQYAQYPTELGPVIVPLTVTYSYAWLFIFNAMMALLSVFYTVYDLASKYLFYRGLLSKKVRKC